MKVTLVKHGGWTAGMRSPPLTVDAASLPESASQELVRLVSAAKAAPPAEDRSGGRACDVMSYKLTVEAGGEHTVLSQSDTTMTKPFETLMEWLEQHAAHK